MGILDFDLTIEEALRAVEVFAAADPEPLARLARTVRTVRLRERDSLFREGQAADRFFVLQSGMVKLFRLSAQGQEKVISLMRPGEIFAMPMMFLQERFYPVHAEALAPCEVLEVPYAAMQALLAESYVTCLQVMRHMSKLLQSHIGEIDGLCLQSAHARLVQFLVDQLPSGGLDQRSGVLLLDYPKQVIAARIGVKPETLSRILSVLSRKGLISVQNRQIVLHDIPALWQEVNVCGRQP